LERIYLPQIDDGHLITLLSKQLEDVNNVALQQVQQHIDQLGKKAEAWISEGFSLQHDEHCPYCGQVTTGVALITAYQSFFSSAYTSLKREVTQYSQKITDDFSDRELLALTNIATNNDDRTKYWSDFLDSEIPKVDIEYIQKT